MGKLDYQNQIRKLLPDTGNSVNSSVDNDVLTDEIESVVQADDARINASALARIKQREIYAAQKKKSKSDAEQKRIVENIAEIEAIEQSPKAQAFLGKGVSDISPYTGTTKRDVIKLMTDLNINISLHLDKSDTYNLLSCLLTANETQLRALYSNTKVPIAIKIVIKRLLDDVKVGNIETVEKLWDRIFGKNQTAAQIQLPDGVAPGLLPNTVVSREAYMIIRDTIIGN